MKPQADQLDDLLDRWEQARSAGRVMDLPPRTDQNRQLLEALERQIADLEKIDHLLQEWLDYVHE